MDPNVSLATIRLLVAQYAKDDELLDQIDTDILTEAIQALDEWLSKGGFLPEAWERKPA